MSMITQVEAQLKDVKELIVPLIQQRERLELELRRLKSIAFIEANGVTEDSIQLSSGDGVPYFGILAEFAKWLNVGNCTKRFCEWNGVIHFTAEVIAGTMDMCGPGRAEDVEGLKL